MAYQAMRYQDSVRVLVEHGDITYFSQILDPRLAGVAPVAAAAGMRRERFNQIRKAGLNFSHDEIAGMAAHFGLTQKKMRELIEADPARGSQSHKGDKS
ncbi:MAG: hypothetical protein ACTHMC_12350 [Pseudobacter sp.]|uniref:hypothetical protein n=1 Tax=Pseudobacter sp. TaxID=2045420 RepID=UPI003F81155A